MREKLDEVISPNAVASIGREGDPVSQNQNPGLGARHAVEPMYCYFAWNRWELVYGDLCPAIWVNALEPRDRPSGWRLSNRYALSMLRLKCKRPNQERESVFLSI